MQYGVDVRENIVRYMIEDEEEDVDVDEMALISGEEGYYPWQPAL